MTDVTPCPPLSDRFGARSARLLTAVGLLTVSLGLFLGDANAQRGPSGPTPVFAATVIEDRFVDEVEALGTLRANESVRLTASVTETVTAVRFEDGQRVKAGDVLIEMTSQEESALLDEAKSRVSEAERQFNRIRRLADEGTASRSLLDTRRREFETARAQLRAIESRLQDRLVLAPFDGVVGLRDISTGALVSPGDVITTLNDDSVMKLDFTVPAPFLRNLRVGLPIRAKAVAFDEEVFEGEISSIDNAIDPVTRSITVRALIPNPEQTLKPGLLMSVELLKNPRTALVIPEEALIPQARQNFVLIVTETDEGTIAERRQVTIGSRRPGEVEILEGLSVGELVITHGTSRARPGTPVEVKSLDNSDAPLTELLQGNGAG